MSQEHLLQRFQECLAEVSAMDLEGLASLLARARHIYIAGNGGSAATASHLASDLLRIGLPCSCLSDNISQLTMYANDVSFADAFASQIIDADERDTLVVLSVSGNSPNLVRAVEIARLHGLMTLAMVGSGGGRLAECCHHSLVSTSRAYGEVEGIHSCICHMLPTLVKELRAHTKAVFLDRDGVINREVHYCSRPEDFELLPGAAHAIQLLNLHHFEVIVITNQSGVGRGYFSLETLHAIHSKMKADLANEGARLDGIYFCPHRPEDNCACRKPQPGLFLQAARDHGVSLNQSYVIGDRESDLGVCQTLPLRGMQVGEGGLLPAVLRLLKEKL